MNCSSMPMHVIHKPKVYPVLVLISHGIGVTNPCCGCGYSISVSFRKSNSELNSESISNSIIIFVSNNFGSLEPEPNVKLDGAWFEATILADLAFHTPPPEEAGHASFIVVNNHMNTPPLVSSESAFYPTLLFLLVYLSCNMSPASL